MARSFSPLRYPGGKSSMEPLVVQILKLNSLERCHYAEPYAGGCGLALTLLFGGFVSDIHINDLDLPIWSFWHSVLKRTQALVDLIGTTPVTIEEWRRQKEIFKRPMDHDALTLGFSAFFLNRTNRSGIISGGGAIGGNEQSGTYKIDCRFNKEDLIKRITRIKKYDDRIHLTRLDGLDFLKRCQKTLPDRSLLFIDPPYYNKGADLYTSFYLPGDHAKLSKTVLKLKRHWIVTYDEAVEVKNLYVQERQFLFDISYSLQEKRMGSEILIASSNLRLPEATRHRQINRPNPPIP